jgi:hypothetical protein
VITFSADVHASVKLIIVDHYLLPVQNGSKKPSTGLHCIGCHDGL